MQLNENYEILKGIAAIYAAVVNSDSEIDGYIFNVEELAEYELTPEEVVSNNNLEKEFKEKVLSKYKSIEEIPMRFKNDYYIKYLVCGSNDKKYLVSDLYALSKNKTVTKIQLNDYLKTLSNELENVDLETISKIKAKAIYVLQKS